MVYDFTKKFANAPRLIDLKDCDAILKLLKITITQAVEADIRILDEKKEDNLILLHYLNSVPGTESVRGLIIDLTDEPIIVAGSFPYTEEFESISRNEFPEKPFVVTKAYEGTILRVFQGNQTGTWYTSTHKKISGRNGRWCGPTFGEIFDEVWGDAPLDQYLNLVGNQRCWVFLASHPESRIVCDIPQAELRLVGLFEDQIMKIDRLSETITHPNVKIQEPISIESYDDFEEFVENLDYRDCTGALLSVQDDDGEWSCLKIVPKEYLENRDLRGNEPNLRLRYLELYKEGSVDKLKNLYPEKKAFFNDIEWYLSKGIVDYLVNVYRTIYGKEYLPKEEHYIIKTARTSHGNDIRTTMSYILANSRPRQLNALIKRAKLFEIPSF